MPLQVVKLCHVLGSNNDTIIHASRIQGDDTVLISTKMNKLLLVDVNDGVILRTIQGPYRSVAQIETVQGSSLTALIYSGQCSIIDVTSGEFVYQFPTKSATDVCARLSSPTCATFYLSCRDKLIVSEIQKTDTYRLVNESKYRIGFTASCLCFGDEYGKLLLCMDASSATVYAINPSIGSKLVLSSLIEPSMNWNLGWARAASIKMIASFSDHCAAVWGEQLIVGSFGAQFKKIILPSQLVAGCLQGSVLVLLLSDRIETRDITSGELFFSSEKQITSLSSGIAWNDHELFSVSATFTETEFAALATNFEERAVWLVISQPGFYHQEFVYNFCVARVISLFDSDDILGALLVLRAVPIDVSKWAKSLWSCLKRFETAREASETTHDVESIQRSTRFATEDSRLMYLERYLVDYRTKYNQAGSDCADSRKYIDTALFLCYIAQNSPLLKVFLRQPNGCDEKEVSDVLTRTSRLDVLCSFFEARGLYEKVLQLIHQQEGIGGALKYVKENNNEGLALTEMLVSLFPASITPAMLRELLLVKCALGPDSSIIRGFQLLRTEDISEAKIFLEEMQPVIRDKSLLWQEQLNLAIASLDTGLLRRCLIESSGLNVEVILAKTLGSDQTQLRVACLIYLERYQEAFALTKAEHLPELLALLYPHTDLHNKELQAYLVKLLDSDMATNLHDTLNTIQAYPAAFGIDYVFERLSDNVLFSDICSFASAKICESERFITYCQTRATVAKCSLNQNLQLTNDLQRRRFVITDRTPCHKCLRPVETSSLSLHPNGVIEHVGCQIAQPGKPTGIKSRLEAI